MPQAANTGVLHRWTHADIDDAKREIWEGVGDIGDFEVTGEQVLIGVYLRPQVTRGGIITLGGSNPADDKWQGKVGLVLKLGPTAFPDREYKARALELEAWNGRFPQPGDWVWADVKATVLDLSLSGPGAKLRKERLDGNWHKDEGWPCRIIAVRDLLGRVQNPGIVV